MSRAPFMAQAQTNLCGPCWRSLCCKCNLQLRLATGLGRERDTMSETRNAAPTALLQQMYGCGREPDRDITFVEIFSLGGQRCLGARDYLATLRQVNL